MIYTQGNQTVDEGNIMFLEVFQSIYEEGTAESGCHHFVTPNGLTDLGNHHQWLLTSQTRAIASPCAPGELHTTFYDIFLTKKKKTSNQNLSKPIDMSICK